MKIVDRIVCTLLSFAVIPVAIFTPIFHWIYQLVGYDLINSLLGGNLTSSQDTGWTEDNFSLYELYGLLKDFGVDFKNLFSSSSVSDTAAELVPYIKVTFAFLILTLVIAFAAGVVSIVSNAKKTQMILGGCGIVSLIGMITAFGKFAEPLVSGNVTIGSLLDISWLSYVTKIESITLSSAWVFMIMLFAGLILWSLSYILTSDNYYKKQGKKQ